MESISVYVSVVPLPVMVRTPVVVLNCRMERRDRGRQEGREGYDGKEDREEEE